MEIEIYISIIFMEKRRTVEFLTCTTLRARGGCISPLRTKGSKLSNSQSPVERRKHKVWKDV